MKSFAGVWRLTAALLLGTAAAGWGRDAVSGEVRIGDTEQRVLEVMGEPRGGIRTRTFRLLYYERGKVELRDGKVTAVDVLSPEAFAHHRKRALELRERERAEGRDLAARRMGDPDFLARPASEQLEYWRSFARSYPGVDLDSDYVTELLRRGEAELAAAEAERAAAAAEREERRAVAAEAERLRLAERVATAEARLEEARASRERRHWGDVLYVCPRNVPYVVGAPWWNQPPTVPYPAPVAPRPRPVRKDGTRPKPAGPAEPRSPFLDASADRLVPSSVGYPWSIVPLR